MKFNSKELILFNINHYDIVSCHYNILNKYNFPIEFLKDLEKFEKNISIGKLMAKNENLKNFLRSTTEVIVDDFIFKNKIKEEEIILRQYDGLMIRNKLNNNYSNSEIKLQLQSIFETFIISFDRKSYIAINQNKEIICKGFSNHYSNIKKYWNKLLLINFMNKIVIFKSIQKIKEEILNSKNKKDFLIPIQTVLNENKYLIYLKEFGPMEIGNSSISLIDEEDIDKKKYFDIFIKPFTKSIIVQFI